MTLYCKERHRILISIISIVFLGWAQLASGQALQPETIKLAGETKPGAPLPDADETVQEQSQAEILAGQSDVERGQAMIRRGEVKMRAGKDQITVQKKRYTQFSSTFGDAATATALRKDIRELSDIETKWRTGLAQIEDGENLVSQGREIVADGRTDIQTGTDRIKVDAAQKLPTEQPEKRDTKIPNTTTDSPSGIY